MSDLFKVGNVLKSLRQQLFVMVIGIGVTDPKGFSGVVLYDQSHLLSIGWMTHLHRFQGAVEHPAWELSSLQEAADAQ